MKGYQMDRREFLALIGYWILLAPAMGMTPMRSKDDGLQGFSGHLFEYEVSCPVLPVRGRGRIWAQVVSGSRSFLAQADFRLSGVVGAISLQRLDRLASLMEWSDSEDRYRPIWFAEQVSRLGRWRRKVKVFDHLDGRYVEHRISPSGSSRRRRRGKRGPLDDPLSAFFNWRAGSYGPLKEGGTYLIDNLARKEAFPLRLKVLPQREAVSHPPSDRYKRRWRHVVRVTLPRRIKEMVSGDVLVWLDGQWVPVYAVANEVRWVRRLYASLVGRTAVQPPRLSHTPQAPVEPRLWDEFIPLTGKAI